MNLDSLSINSVATLQSTRFFGNSFTEFKLLKEQLASLRKEMKKVTRKFLSNLILSLLFFSVTLSHEAIASSWYRDEIKNSPNGVHELFIKKTSGEFGVVMSIVRNADDIWKQAESGEQELVMQQISKIKKGDEATIIFDMFGCEPDKNGSCKIFSDIVVIDPINKIYFKKSNFALMADEGAIPKGMMHLSSISFKILAEKNDAVGEYIIIVRVQDLVGKKKVILKNNFSIHE